MKNTVSKTPDKNSKNELDLVVLNDLLKYLSRSKTGWQGTMTELCETLNKRIGNKVSVPNSPVSMRRVINRIIYRLRSRKVSVKFNRSKQRIITLLLKS